MVFRLTSAELIAAAEEVFKEEPFIASDEDEYIPEIESEESDVEIEPVIEQEEPYLDEISDEEETPAQPNVLIAKDGTHWTDTPLPQAQTISRNILREKCGAPNFSALYTAKETFKSIMSNEICTIILRETNRKGTRVTEDYNEKQAQKYKDSKRQPPPRKVFKAFTEEEFDAYLGILIAAGVHKSNKEHISEMWKFESLPLIRAAMSRDRFKMFSRFIRFDNQNTRAERSKSDKAAPIRDIWIMLNSNLEKNYKPSECITVDEQLFPYRGHTKFTQYIPSKPAKYGIKIFWACDAANAYPLQGKIYTGKLPDGERQVNIGERTVLDLVTKYKGSGRNITTDNFFTSLQLACNLNFWNLTLVGTVRKNKTFIPSNMQPNKNRVIHSTNFAFTEGATICSYVPKKNKSVILLSSMHTTGEVEDTVTAKPEIIKYYNKTKGGVDTMDKMLSEYTVKRRTNRWPLAFFYNMVDLAALSAYIIYTEHTPRLTSTDRRRRFLKDLANELCMAAVLTRSSIPRVLGNHFTRASLEMVLGRQITQPVVTAVRDQSSRDASGRILVVGKCYICRELNHRQRKTRKACNSCSKPVCNEHSVTKAVCDTCNQQTV